MAGNLGTGRYGAGYLGASRLSRAGTGASWWLAGGTGSGTPAGWVAAANRRTNGPHHRARAGRCPRIKNKRRRVGGGGAAAGADEGGGERGSLSVRERSGVVGVSADAGLGGGGGAARIGARVILPRLDPAGAAVIRPGPVQVPGTAVQVAGFTVQDGPGFVFRSGRIRCSDRSGKRSG